MATHDTKSLYIAFFSLLGLLVATITLYFMPFGAAHVWVGLGVACTKTIIVVLVFMGLMKSIGAARLAAGASLLWLSFAMLLVMADYMTRGWDETQEPDLRNADRFTTYDRVENSVPPTKSAADPKSK